MPVTPPTVSGADIAALTLSINSALEAIATFIDSSNANIATQQSTLTSQATSITALQTDLAQKAAELSRKLRRAGVY